MDPLNGKNYEFWGKEVDVGIDEAGRGPVLGSMVYGCAFWPSDPEDHAVNMKKRYGFADSKQLSEEQRDKIFDLIQQTQFKDIGFFVDILSAEYLSNTMLGEWDKGGKNLNKISHDSAIGLILKVRDLLGFKIRRVILDTVGQPEKYKAIVQQALGPNSQTQVIIESKADDTYPIVSAASICAKVTRDNQLKNYQFREKNREFGRDFGCGYPGDKITINWLKEHLDPVFGFPTVVRFSWKTASKILEDQGIKIEWHDQEIQNGISIYNKTEQKNQLQIQQQRQQMEKNRLNDEEKERKMNIAVYHLNLSRNIDQF